MDTSTRTRNRQHLAKGLALGLRIEGAKGHYRIESESSPTAMHAVHLRAGRWFCGCRWSTEHMIAGYDPRSDAQPCQHTLIAIAHDLPIKAQDHLMRDDAGLRAAAESGMQIRSAKARAAAERAQATHAATIVQAIVAAGTRSPQEIQARADRALLDLYA